MANNIYKSGGTCFRYKALVGTGGVTKGQFVIVSSNTVVAATDGSACAGVALTTAASGAYVEVIYGPVIIKTTAASGVNFGHLDVCYIATATTVDTGATTNKSCGRVVETDPATAGTVYMLLHTPGLTDTHTHA